MKAAGSTDHELRRLVGFVVGRGLKTFLAELLKQLQFVHPTAQLTEQVVGVEVGMASRRIRVQQGGKTELGVRRRWGWGGGGPAVRRPWGGGVAAVGWLRLRRASKGWREERVWQGVLLYHCQAGPATNRRTRAVTAQRPARRILGANLGRVCVYADIPVSLRRAAGLGCRRKYRPGGRSVRLRRTVGDGLSVAFPF